MSILKKNGGMVRPPSQSSAKTFMPVGSGSRPTMSKHELPTSAPSAPRHLDSRHVKGALGVK
jgi:hypothetical protein